MGGFLAIELEDFAWAIREGEVRWVRRWLDRFPLLRQAHDFRGTPFRKLAEDAGNEAIVKLFTGDESGTEPGTEPI